MQRSNENKSAEVSRMLERRRFLKTLAAGAVVTALGGTAYMIGRDLRAEQVLPDGRRRLPPGQRTLVEAAGTSAEPALIRQNVVPTDRERVPGGQIVRETLRPMGGIPGNPSREAFRLKVHGEVKRELLLDFNELLAMQQVEQVCDVHCVVGWSVLGATWKGVRVSELAERAGLTSRARYVIFECAGGFTANIDIEEALKPNVLAAYEYQNQPLGQPFGAPLRSLVPDRYFWKSAKWLEGIRFVEHDERGYWEQRGYHNHGDPWKEQRYAENG
jgi:DMSO/TMAO reductase YedYZ molybdopterin-dependent catalytic subunit